MALCPLSQQQYVLEIVLTLFTCYTDYCRTGKLFVIVIDVQLLEEEEVEVPIVKEPAKDAAKMETDEAPNDSTPSATENDINMQDAKADASGPENGVPESGDKPVQMETDAKVSKKHCVYKRTKCLFLLFLEILLI